jgi:hypothetical protein
MAPALDDMHGYLVPKDLWEVQSNIFIQHVKQFGSKLDSSGSTTTNNK